MFLDNKMRNPIQKEESKSRSKNALNHQQRISSPTKNNFNAQCWSDTSESDENSVIKLKDSPEA